MMDKKESFLKKIFSSVSGRTDAKHESSQDEQTKKNKEEDGAIHQNKSDDLYQGKEEQNRKSESQGENIEKNQEGNHEHNQENNQEGSHENNKEGNQENSKTDSQESDKTNQQETNNKTDNTPKGQKKPKADLIADPRNEAIIAILKTIEDPEISIDIWTLELIYDIIHKEQGIDILLTFTSPMCPYGPHLMQMVKDRIEERGITPVDVKVTFSPPWKPSEDVREMLGV